MEDVITESISIHGIGMLPVNNFIRIMRCVFDVLSETLHNQYKIMMYMNFTDFSRYQHCENTYWGYIEHYDAVTNIVLTNQDHPMEKASVQILASYLDADTKWGLWNGFSSRPMMPIAMKMLFSRTPLKEDLELVKKLKVSKEDIRPLKIPSPFLSLSISAAMALSHFLPQHLYFRHMTIISYH